VTQEQKRRPEKTQRHGKGEGKALNTNRLCAQGLQIEKELGFG